MTIPKALNILFLVILFNFNFISCQDSDELSLEYQELKQIRENFQLQSAFPDPEPYNFCANNSYFKCDPILDSVLTMNLDGLGIVSYIPNLTVFEYMHECAFKRLVDPTAQVLFVNSSHLTSLTCQYCQIQTIPENSAIESILSLVDISNNPITSGTIYLSKAPKSGVFINPDPLYSQYFIQTINDLTPSTSINAQSLKIMVNSDDFSLAYMDGILTVQVTDDIPSTFNFTKLISTFSGLNLQIFSASLTTYEYDFPTSYPNTAMVVTFKNIRFLKPIDYIDFSGNTLVSIFVENSPNFNINGQFPINKLSSHLALLKWSGCNLTGEFPMNLLQWSQLTTLDLSFNSITSLPTSLDSTNQVLQLNVSNNLITGVIPYSFCTRSIDFSNNSITGDIPSCLSCYLNQPSIRNLLRGNSFSNYQDGSDVYPNCTTLDVVSYTTFGSNGINFKIIDGPRNSNQYFSDLSSTIGGSVYLYNSSITPYFPVGSYYTMASRGYANFTFYTNPIIQKIVPVNLVISPEIQNIWGFPATNGYLFSIIVINYYGDMTNTFVTFDKTYSCFITEVDTYSIDCLITTFNIAEKVYNVNVTVAGVSDFYQYKFSKLFPIITSIYSTDSSGGPITLYGYFGPDLSNVSVSIMNQSCPIVNAFSNNITCIIPPGNFSFQEVVLNVLGTNATFIYYYQEPSDCTRNCGVNGRCNQYGTCDCFNGFSGPTCSLLYTNSSIIVDNNSTTIGHDTTSFKISIRSIAELKYDKSVVSEYFLSNWELASTPDKNTWIYRILLNNGQTEVSYTIFRAPQSMNYTFAGQSVSLAQDAIKISVNITGWVFSSYLNSLQLSLSTNVHSDSACTDTNINSSNQNKDTIDSFTIERDGKVLYGKFLDQMLSDGKATYSSTKVLSKDESEIIVGISMPHCSSCILDPDFSILINPSGGCPDSDKRSWVLPLSVTLSVVGGTVLIVATILMFKKFHLVYYSNNSLVVFGKVIKLKTKYFSSEKNKISDNSLFK